MESTPVGAKSLLSDLQATLQIDKKYIEHPGVQLPHSHRSISTAGPSVAIPKVGRCGFLLVFYLLAGVTTP